MILEMFVNIGLVWVFNATELISAVYKENKGGLDSLNEAYVYLCQVQIPGTHAKTVPVYTTLHFVPIHFRGKCTIQNMFSL